MKKTTITFTVVILMMTLCCSMVKAEKSESQIHRCVYRNTDFDYIILDDGTAEIVKVAWPARELPGTLDGYTVTAIGERAYAAGNGSYEIPNSVTRIGDYAFSAQSIYNVVIPDSVISIGANPFADCSDLHNIYVSNNNPNFAVVNNVLFGKKDKRLIAYVPTLKDKEYEIPQGIKIIGDSAFSCAMHLENIIIPESVEYIGSEAFRYCFDLDRLTLPNSIISLGENLFDGLNSEIIVSPDHPTLSCVNGNLISKEEHKLIHCYLKISDYYVIPQEVEIIGAGALANKQVTKITIPDGVKQIGKSAFSECTRLKTINLPDGIMYVADSLFMKCKSLTSIQLPEGITRIGNKAFAECENLSSINIPDGVTYIGNDAFAFCKNLSSISIPNGVTYIGDRAFELNQLKEINIPESVNYIGSAAFFSCPIEKAIISGGVEKIEQETFANCDELTEVIIPDTVNSIGSHAFSGCYNLKNLVISENVTDIADNAFDGCHSLIITVKEKSYAEQYCIKNKLHYSYSTYSNSLDWLND